jgi:peptidoglycan/xylan/chitin deacetylase (PgdA/CDA1 family)
MLYARASNGVRHLGEDGRIPVLMYHNICEGQETGVHGYYRVSTSPERFYEQMRFLSENGYTTVTVENALERAGASGSGRTRREVALTFDDGLADFATNAWPVLNRFGFTASVFLATGFIDDHRRCFDGKACLTWSEVRDLARLGIAFGSHTVSHPKLALLNWPRIRSELRDSREEIRHQTANPVTAFSYPFAFPQNDRVYVSSFRRMLREEEYRCCVTTMIGRLARGDDPLLIRRLPVNDLDDAALFRAKLAGAYDWAALPQSLWKQARELRRRGRAECLPDAEGDHEAR